MSLTARTFAIFALCLTVCPTPAWAQLDDDDDDDEEQEFEPDPIDPDELSPSDREIPEGATENPNAVPEFDETIEDGSAEVKKVRTGYPIEVALRPLTLASGMSEISLDVPTNVNPFLLTGLLRARYGVTREIQIGLAYGPGALDSDTTFISGKTVGVEFNYLIQDWISAQLSLPILMDPFSMGMTLGAPMKFRFGEKFAILTGHDFLHISLNRFVPSVDNPAFNEQQVAANEIGTVLDSGELRFLGAVIYQLSPDLALMGESGIIARDFSNTDAGVPLLVRAIYSTSNKLDLGGKLGFGDLSDAGNTFGATVFLALRI